VLRTLLASVVLSILGIVVLAAATDRFQAFTSETARRIAIQRHPPEIPGTELETQDGRRVSFTDLRGRWLVVDFIYTRCPSYCSLLGGEFSQLQGALAGPLTQGKVTLLSISFDPVHDDPERLSDYLRRFGNHGVGWLAARPSDPASLIELEHAFGVTVVPDGSGGFVHNAALEIVDPRGRLVVIVDMGDPSAVGQMLLRRMQ